MQSQKSVANYFQSCMFAKLFSVNDRPKRLKVNVLLCQFTKSQKQLQLEIRKLTKTYHKCQCIQLHIKHRYHEIPRIIKAYYIESQETFKVNHTILPQHYKFSIYDRECEMSCFWVNLNCRKTISCSLHHFKSMIETSLRKKLNTKV